MYSQMWPQEADDTIREHAERAHSGPLADAALKILKDIVFGDLEKVDSIIEAIYHAKESLTATLNELEKHSQKVELYWTGDAANSFKEWLGKYQASIEQAFKVMDTLEAALQEFAEIVVNQYGQAIRLVADIAAKLIDALSGISIDKIVFGAAMIIMEIIAEFTSKAGEIIDTGLQNARKHRAAIQGVESKLAEFGQMLPAIAFVGAPGSWQPRKTA